MSRPSKHEINDQIRQLRKINWSDLERRLTAALDRDRTGSTRPDGYPAGTLGGGRGSAELTSTESAAEQRAFGRTTDPLRLHVEHAVAALTQAVDATTKLTARLDTIDRLASPVEPEPCEACARFATNREIHGHRIEDMILFTDSNGRLDRHWRLGSWCYDQVRRSGEIPTEDRTVRYYQGRPQQERVS